jgi:hypothetical protein
MIMWPSLCHGPKAAGPDGAIADPALRAVSGKRTQVSIGHCLQTLEMQALRLLSLQLIVVRSVYVRSNVE